MAYPVTLPVVGAVSLAGAALGIYFGHGAIAEVKPFYFSPPPVSHFYADLTPAGYHPAEINPVSMADFWTNEANASGRGECFDCRNQIDAVFSASDQSPATPGPYSVEVDEPSVEAPLAPDVERYANFPVTAEEAATPRTQMAAAEQQPDAGNPVAVDSGPVGM